MTQPVRKSQVRRRIEFTGERYQQAQQRMADVEDGLPSIPDAADPGQRMVESAVLYRLLAGARAQWTVGERPRFPLFVQAVSPTAAGLRLDVPIDDVGRFGAALSGQAAADALTIRRADRGVSVTADEAPGASVHMLCSWDRLSEAASASRLSMSALHVDAPEPAPLTSEHRAVLSGLLRRVALFNAVPPLEWLCAWHEWLAAGRAGEMPSPPAELAFALSRPGFGLMPEQRALLGIRGASRAAPVTPARRPVLTAPTGWTFTHSGPFLASTTATELLAADGLDRMTGSAEYATALRMLAEEIVRAGLGSVRLLIGYRLPFTSHHVDVLVAGLDAETRQPSYVVVSFKSWTAVRDHEGSDVLADVGLALPRLHPAVEAGDYADYLHDLLIPDRAGAVRGAVYLYNAAEEDVTWLRRRPSGPGVQIFTRGQGRALRDFFRRRFADADPGETADELTIRELSSRRGLVARAASELTSGSGTTLLHDQRVAYELVLHAVERAAGSDRKTVVVVSGGPGSGKSLAALRLLGELARQGRSVLHATGSKSFTQTLRRHAGRGSTRLRSLFLYFNSFMTAERDSVDVLVCDEAHRLRETSVNRFTRPPQRRVARPQVDELIAAARVPVFFLDETQVVKPGELGSVEHIAAGARRLGVAIEVVSLSGQFRLGGSEAYDRWVADLLDPAGTPSVWPGDDRFEVRLAESPEEMESFLAAKHASGETARIAAGYCWPWSDPRPDDTLVADVRIGAWSRPWIVKNDRGAGHAPGSPFWATDPNGFGQIGQIYTAQGFEYDWAGVIIGPDLVARDGRLTVRREECLDPSLRGPRAGDEAVERYIRSTYRVLLTRGMRGVVVFATDPETRAYLSELMG